MESYNRAGFDKFDPTTPSHLRLSFRQLNARVEVWAGYCLAAGWEAEVTRGGKLSENLMHINPTMTSRDR